MEEMEVKMEPTLHKGRKEPLQEFLRTAIGHFRNGEDATGMEDFLSGMDELKRMVENDWNSQRPNIDMNQLLPATRKLYFFIQNQDITGIADLLEDTLVPLTKEWPERRDDT
jgi:hypothetical protein